MVLYGRNAALTVTTNTRIVFLRQTLGYEASDIASLSQIFLKPQGYHELVHDPCAVLHGPVFVCRLHGTQSIPRQRRDYDMIWEVFARPLLPDQLTHGQELNEAAWPAVHKDDGDGILIVREEGDKVDINIFNLHRVVWK